MLLHTLQSKGLIQPPKWLADNTAYMTIMGSLAYGVSSDASDEDIYGFCLPPKDMVFPHLAGEILGFGNQVQRFNVWQQHHVRTEDGAKEYDFSIYSIVSFFQLCMENNPNMIDSLFTPERCVKHSTVVGRLVRDNRKMFLHKGSWHKFKGYAFGQVKKMDTKRQNVPEIGRLRDFASEAGLDLSRDWEEIAAEISHEPLVQKEFFTLTNAVERMGRRYVGIAKYGFDVKFAYHVVRLLLEVEQILNEGDLDLERGREQLKSIRRGEWTEQRIIDWFESKEKALETAYEESKLPHGPDEKAIKALLLQCLETHYGSLGDAVQKNVPVDVVLREIQAVIDRHR